jgi:glycine cleavage system aminomethyltransferase T
MPEFDMSLVQRGARLRRSPYYEATQRHGPLGFTVYNHMLFPIRFDSFEAEFEALLNDVTVWDVSVERCLEVAGPDGFRFAQLLTPRDLAKCEVGQAKYVLICDSDGGIINDPVMTRMDETTFWFALASSDVLLFARGLRNAYPDLDVTLRELDVAPMQIQGPRSRALLRDLVGPAVEDLRYYRWMHAEVGDIPVVVTRTGWTSEVGYELYLLDPARGTELWERVMEAGRPYRVRPTGPSDIRRIEGGIFNWGADMTYQDNPLEMGLERLVDWHLPDTAAISLPALRRIREEGIQRRIVGIEIDGDPLPALNFEKWPAYPAEGSSAESLGKVTSAIYSPRLGRNVGYCWVPADLAEPGTALRLATEWGPRNATVVPMPFVDPEKTIPVS